MECGQHFEHRSGQRATAAALEFAAHFGLLDKNDGEAATATATEPKRRFELLKTFVVQTEDFRFVRPLLGFETFAEGELIATDGDQEIRALCADCTVFMPARRAIIGREAVYLTRPLE